MDNLLSICIPTYNRSYLLNEQLKQLTKITSKYNIPIYISDNNSQDDTESVVKNYIEEGYDIHYKKQFENIGPDRNFQYLLENSKGKYKWLFSDTTIFSEEEIKLFLNRLDNNDYDFVVTGTKSSTESYTSKLYDKNSNELLSYLGWHMTYVSCLIYNQKVIDSLFFDRYYNSRFLQTGIIFEYCSNHNFKVFFDSKFKVSGLQLDNNESLSKYRNNHWDNIVIDVFARDWYLFIMSLPVSYSYESKLTCIKKHAIETKLFNFDHLFNYKINNYINLSIVKKNKFFIKQILTIKNYILLLVVCCIPYQINPFYYYYIIRYKYYNDLKIKKIKDQIKQTQFGKRMLYIKHHLNK
jgi:abequosyltransferase